MPIWNRAATPFAQPQLRLPGYFLTPCIAQENFAAGMNTDGSSIYATPFHVPHAVKIDQLSLYVTDNTGGGGYIVGIYDSYKDGTPRNKLWSPIVQSVSAVQRFDLAISPDLEVSGLFWAALSHSTTTDLFAFFDNNGNGTIAVGTGSLPSSVPGAPGSPGVIATHSYTGTMPAVFPTTGFAPYYQAPAMFLRVA